MGLISGGTDNRKQYFVFRKMGLYVLNCVIVLFYFFISLFLSILCFFLGLFSFYLLVCFFVLVF